jgi:hypothetical protein
MQSRRQVLIGVAIGAVILIVVVLHLTGVIGANIHQ